MQKHLYSFLSLLFAATFFSGQLAAQCERVGRVNSITPDCGAQILDLDNGQTLHAVAGADGLSGSQTFTFNSQTGVLPPGCQAGPLPVVSLTCVSEQLPCKAQFARLPNALQLLGYKFVAQVYDEAVQTCHWDFGDPASAGAGGNEATGKEVEHLFSGEGNFTVCLTVTDAFGCSAQKCALVSVSKDDYYWCGWDIQVTAVGTELQGKIFPTTSDADLILDSVQWYSNKSSQILSEAPSFSAPLPGYGDYTVCAQYKVTNVADGSACYGTRCQTITVAEQACANPALVDASSLCPGPTQFYAPVCGCDGVTYANECEALSTGISQWWAGECGSVFGACLPKLQAKILSGSPDGGFTAQFCNLSDGDYTFAQLDFGDGSPLLEGIVWDTILHYYDSAGIYKANLTVWSANGCISSVTQLVVTDAMSMVAEQLPQATDYVMPGDADRNQRANVYDLLNLGVGHYTTGAPRPEASTDWNPQFAPNWDETLTESVNYKHLDCDGNGSVNEFDADVVLQHYTAIDTTEVSLLPSLPQLRLQFEKDTILVDPNNPAPVEINAWVKVGSPTQPALGLYGLAFALRYPDYVNHNPDADYDDDLFGSTNHLLWLSKDIHDRSQLDLGLTRKNGLGVNGYGRVAKVTFSTDIIIIIDIIARGESKPVPFAVPIRGLKAIDKEGNEFEISVPAEQDTVWIKTLETSGTDEEMLRAKVLLSPNPAADATELYTSDLHVEAIEMLNSLGQKVRSFQPSGSRSTRLDVSGWASGVYTLRVRAEEGMVEKRLVLR
ncbi:MAG: PKD domain-containing protein [Saprospiraceae bacterium]